MTQEQKLLQYAAEEIKTLRKQNELMGARLDVFDQMMRLFHSTPNWGNSGLMHPDPLWEIEKYLESTKDTTKETL